MRYRNYTLTEAIKARIAKEAYYDEADFINDVKSYIEAVASGRMLYTVMSVSTSGMSRNISIKSFEGKMTKGYYRNYTRMFDVLGYSLNKYYELKVSGCGMNMLFATNYNLIHKFYNMNFINKKDCDSLAQKIN